MGGHHAVPLAPPRQARDGDSAGRAGRAGQHTGGKHATGSAGGKAGREGNNEQAAGGKEGRREGREESITKNHKSWNASTREQMKIVLLYKRVLLGREGRKKTMRIRVSLNA